MARSLETGDFVAIKIIQRFSKRRKLGRVTVSPEGKTKREIAILKKVRHANVVGLLEVIDDPELKKIYVVLEHVELGEIVWRRKGAPHVCLYERRRVEKEHSGEKEYLEDEKHYKASDRHRLRKAVQCLRNSQIQLESNYSCCNRERGHDEYDNLSTSFRENPQYSQCISSRDSWLLSNPDSQISSGISSRATSARVSRAHTPLPSEIDTNTIDLDHENSRETRSLPFLTLDCSHGSCATLDALSCGSNTENKSYSARSPSVADSIISYMSSIDDICHDALEEDYSYVPCFTIDQARSAFRDTVLGLEYLHYEGIVHRDIKPANLLWTKDHRVKISDFGVSYFGRPIRDDETEENVSEAEATDFDDDLELAKTVGTPAFFAPELCCTDLDTEQPKVTEQIDVWSLGVTLYCLIFARIPFLANDEWQLFRSIAQDEVYIPRLRLKAVDQIGNQLPGNAIKRSGSSASRYREENEIAFEFVDDELYDLLKRMLIKDPTQRIKLREVKRHPWLLRGVDNIIGWLDDTDPSRVTAGLRIQVNKHELERAVVPLTFLERARTAVKKAVGKVIGAARSDTRSDRSRGSRGTRPRAQSSATSSGTDTNLHTPVTPIMKSSRRSSLREDEALVGFLNDSNETNRGTKDRPLAQILTANFDNPLCTADSFRSILRSPGSGTVYSTDGASRLNAPDQMISNMLRRNSMVQRGHSYSRSAVSTSSLSPFGDEPRTPIMKNISNVLL